jgi:hypothetical protein
MNRRKLMWGSMAAITTALPLEGQADAFGMEIARIIKLVNMIEVGQKREMLERDWIPDGGIQVIYQTRYKLKTCQNIKIDVDFYKSSTSSFNDPNAAISKVSLPYLQYPAYD